MPDPQPDTPQDFKAEVDESKPGCAALTWKASTNAKSYEVLVLPTMTLRTTKAVELTICHLEEGAKYSFEITAVGDGGRSEAAKSEPVVAPTGKPSGTWLLTSWSLVGLLVVAAVVAQWVAKWPKDSHDSLAFACGVVAFGLALLTLSGGKYGFWRAVIGADQRVSTSYLTTGLWTVLVAFVLAYLTGQTWFHDMTDLFKGFQPGATDTGGETQVWDDYLVLLGGPFAALVFARGIVSSKVEGQTVQKTVADDGTADLRQALTDDSGNIDLVDSQYLLFNVVALSYVIVAFASTGLLPQVPAVLLALTGSSAATYVVNKAVTNASPVVSGVAPSSFRPGERITVTGSNFMPGGPERPPVVTIGGKQALVESEATSAQVTAIVPPGTPAGTQELVLTTAARATTTARPVEVLADKPQILAVDPPTPTVGKPMSIRGVGFSSALDPTNACAVLIEGAAPQSAVPSRLTSGVDELTLVTPADAPVTAAANVTVQTARLTSSDPVKVTFKAPPPS